MTSQQIFIWMGKAIGQIEDGLFASALITLNQLDAVTDGMQKAFTGFDLLRGLCSFVLKQDDNAIRFFESEYRTSENGYALILLQQYQVQQISAATGLAERLDIVDTVLYSDKSGQGSTVCGYLALCLGLVEYALKNGLTQNAVNVYELILTNGNLKLPEGVKRHIQSNLVQLKQQLVTANMNQQNVQKQTILR